VLNGRAYPVAGVVEGEKEWPKGNHAAFQRSCACVGRGTDR